MLAGLLSVLSVLTVRSRCDDPDMWEHLKRGQILWSTHTLPTKDIFPYTTHHHLWLAQRVALSLADPRRVLAGRIVRAHGLSCVLFSGRLIFITPDS